MTRPATALAIAAALLSPAATGEAPHPDPAEAHRLAVRVGSVYAKLVDAADALQRTRATLVHTVEGRFDGGAGARVTAQDLLQARDLLDAARSEHAALELSRPDGGAAARGEPPWRGLAARYLPDRIRAVERGLVDAARRITGIAAGEKPAASRLWDEWLGGWELVLVTESAMAWTLGTRLGEDDPQHHLNRAQANLDVSTVNLLLGIRAAMTGSPGFAAFSARLESAYRELALGRAGLAAAARALAALGAARDLAGAPGAQPPGRLLELHAQSATLERERLAAVEALLDGSVTLVERSIRDGDAAALRNAVERTEQRLRAARRRGRLLEAEIDQVRAGMFAPAPKPG